MRRTVPAGWSHGGTWAPLADINLSNVDQLEIAWTWKPDELPNQESQTGPGSVEAMPLMIDTVVSLSTMYNRFRSALNPMTLAVNGRTIDAVAEPDASLAAFAWPDDE